MPDEPSLDPFWVRLCAGYSEAEVKEIEQHLTAWEASTYTSIPHSILDHAFRKQVDPLKYLIKAHNFTKKGEVIIPKSGYRGDNTAIYRKRNEYLIVKTDAFGVEKIVTYGVNDE